VYSPAGKSAPHARGWSPRYVWLVHPEPVGPARAGMVLRGHRDVRRSVGRPRTRGDGPYGDCMRERTQRSAPHARGWSRRSADLAGQIGVGPARAGMVPRSAPACGRSGRRPRTRGDGPRPAQRLIGGRLSAPHARGWSLPSRQVGRSSEVGPARAGMVLVISMESGPRPSRPRTRGDGPSGPGTGKTVRGSAPHARGWSPHPGFID